MAVAAVVTRKFSWGAATDVDSFGELVAHAQRTHKSHLKDRDTGDPLLQAERIRFPGRPSSLSVEPIVDLDVDEAMLLTCSWRCSKLAVDIGGDPHNIDFQSMRQTNLRTGAGRRH